MKILSYTYEELLELVESFHGHVAPGVILGAFMVDMARGHIPEGVLFDAVAETPKCLPDSIQLLTPCTVGNGWLRVMNLGRYALSLFELETGRGVRVFLDAQKLDDWSEIKTWLFKTKPKKEQDKDLLMDQIKSAGQSILGLQPIQVGPHFLRKRRRGAIEVCVLCGEAYPARDGGICRGCQGEAPYVDATGDEGGFAASPLLKALPVHEAEGKTTLHDMTRIIPAEAKGPAFLKGHKISAGDMCRLQQMGRNHVYVMEDNPPQGEWVHENEAAMAFAGAMAGEGVEVSTPPREGKVTLTSTRPGMLMVDVENLERFNMVPDVMCGSRKSYTLVREGKSLAGTRAIPLFISKSSFTKGMAVLEEGPLFRVLPLRKAKVGILVTGSEIFQGLVEDRFVPIITSKVERYESEVVHSVIVPDDREAIRNGVRELLDRGADLLVTTAGLSVDPDDVTRQGLVDAGLSDLLYGAAVLPGAMTLLGRIGTVRVMGVPACALYFKTTSFDILFPRLLADVDITRVDLARLGHGGFCLDCKTCTYPKCTFGC